MQTGNFRGFEVAQHDPGIALIAFNQNYADRPSPRRQGRRAGLSRKTSTSI
jgi:hypothetical protein